MKYFSSPEANILFTLSVLAEKTVKKAQKRFDNKDISAERFKELRNEMLKIIFNTNKAMEEVSKQYITKKAYRTQEKKRKNNV